MSPPGPATGWRTPIRSVRLFLSSTFLDMQEEREELIRRVFPGLRERCEVCGVNWGEVDLRWGVTEDESREGLALPICLAEIDECRPFFLAVLGQRYGWVPEVIDPEVVARYPWLSGVSGRSVTELEIRHGALNDGSPAALFYFRDPAWLDRLPASVDRAQFESADPEAKRRLAALKAAIVAAGYLVRVYRDPRELGPLVRDDMTRLLDQFLPAVPPDDAERDAAAQKALTGRLAAGHVGREGELRRLDHHANMEGAPVGLLVTGAPGAGKSSLLAKWMALREGSSVSDRRPRPGPWWWPLRRDASGPTFDLAHFAGASVGSIGVAAMLRRLTVLLDRRAGTRREIPDGPVGLAAAFAGALAQEAARERVTLVLDGLDQIDPRAQGLDLAWLPDPVPVRVRLVASAGPGPVTDELVRRGWRTLELGPIDRSGRTAFVSSYLWQNHHKKLDGGQVEAVAAVAAGANARFLRTFLEELVASARGIEDLTGLIRRYASATTTGALFDLMLARLEPAHGRGRPGLVAEALSLLWASRCGLSDREAAELLGRRGDLLPAAVWVPLRHALRPFTTSWSGLVGLPAAGLREAVERRYLGDPAVRAAAHRRLADYFARRPISGRVVEERPWHLAAVGDWVALARLLADPDFLQTAWPAHGYELGAYWRAVEAETPIRMVDVLTQLADAAAPAALAAAQLLADAGHRAAALGIGRRQAAGAAGLAVLDLAARLAMESGDLAAARAFSTRQAAEAGASGDADARVAALARLAAVERRLATVARSGGGPGAEARALGHERAAADHLDQAERLAGSTAAQDRLADLLGQRARWLDDQGKRAEALALCDRRARLYRQLGDLAGLQDTAAHRGRLLAALRKSSRALAALDEAEALARRLHDPTALQAALGDRADVLTARRRLDDALRVIVERERVCRDALGDSCALALTLLQKALLFGAVMKRTAIGLDLVEQAEELARTGGCAEALARASVVRAVILGAGLRPTF
jgi:hypothetical protein